jgi:rhodanese-related sulfurtransferase
MFGSPIKEVNATELNQWLADNSQPLRIIDVRGMEEIAGGSVPNAMALPLHTLPARVQDMSKEIKTVVLCHSGGRSAQACHFLQQQGFANIYNLRGGMMGWRQSGFAAYPVSQ